MKSYIVTLITAKHQRLRAAVLAGSSVEACKSGHSCAVASGHVPVGMFATLVSRWSA